MSIKIKNNLPRFQNAAVEALDLALDAMGSQIERLSKIQVPVKDGQLQDTGKHVRVKKLKHIIRYNKVYAAYQHEGGDGKRVIRNYSSPGTKKHFLIDPGNLVAQKAKDYLKEASQRIKI